MRVLVVEPDDILGSILQVSLEAVGCSVELRRTAQSALDALDETVPDCIVLEVQLGIHNGVEFLYEIRSYPEWQHIPVVIHTINSSLAMLQFGTALRQLGVRQVLYKPKTTTQQLVGAILSLVTA